MSKTRTEQLMAEIEAAHEFQADGQVYSWDACGTTGEERCPICGLVHRWFSGGQNSPDSDKYLRDDQPICLTDAVRCR